MSQEAIRKLRDLIAESDNIVFFGGAGVSTESGIPDFRSVDGLYHQQYKYPPETILSHSFFVAHTDEYYDFVVDGSLCAEYVIVLSGTGTVQSKDRDP